MSGVTVRDGVLFCGVGGDPLGEMGPVVARWWVKPEPGAAWVLSGSSELCGSVDLRDGWSPLGTWTSLALSCSAASVRPGYMN